METKTIILGTAGHIDHGKTALVKAVTGIDTDRLKEEKERGITIELGFAYLDLPSGRRVGVVDVPGHERFVKNMVAGAMGMDLVALVVAADEGVMPQTREHLEICQLLGVKKGLIVLTKKDMVDEEWLELVTEDVRDFVAGTFLEGAPLLAVSSTTGDGIEAFVSTVDHLVSEVTPKAPVGPYRLPVDRVFSAKGFGTVVTGTSISGHISVGDDVCIYPRGLKSKIRGIQIHGGNVQEAQPGLRTALNLHGIDREQVVRGDVVSLPESLHPSYLLDLQFLYLASADRRLKHRSPVRFHVGTAEVIGRMYLQGDELAPGTEAFAQIKLDDPVAVLPGDHYVIRSYSPIRTIGGGRILHPVPRKRKRTRPELWKELETIAGGVPEELISYHVERSGIRGLSQPEIAMRSGVYGKRLNRELERLLSAQKVVKLDSEGQKYLHGTVYEGLKAKAVTILQSYHKANPLVQGLSKEELKSRLFPRLVDSRVFQRLLADMVKSGDVFQEKDLVRLSTHRVALGEKEEALRKRIVGLFRESGLQPPSRTEAVDKVGEDAASAARIFDLLVREGELVRLKEDLFFHRVALESLKDMVVRFIKEHGELGINDFRDLTGGLSRKYMIPLLEYFDNQHVTLRIGDTRKLRG
jgi:selenocysteine-specific elongation factor